MTIEQIERLQDAWFPLRDVAEEEPSAELISIMNRLHDFIDRELGCDIMKQIKPI